MIPHTELIVGTTDSVHDNDRGTAINVLLAGQLCSTPNEEQLTSRYTCPGAAQKGLTGNELLTHKRQLACTSNCDNIPSCATRNTNRHETKHSVGEWQNKWCSHANDTPQCLLLHPDQVGAPSRASPAGTMPYSTTPDIDSSALHTYSEMRSWWRLQETWQVSDAPSFSATCSLSSVTSMQKLPMMVIKNCLPGVFWLLSRGELLATVLHTTHPPCSSWRERGELILETTLLKESMSTDTFSVIVCAGLQNVLSEPDNLTREGG